MADRIAQDPNLETIPNHASPHYNALRGLLVGTGLSQEEAVLSLNQTWLDTHDERVAAWNLQVQEGTQALDEARNIAEEQEREVQVLKKKEIKIEQCEIGGKNPK
ncbi:hypothetical protein BYT27DRAFT_7258455 [Phlegmacium glaucopus]|nr:hypothetical protein BYT27DRAFT_7258455 [Phlegmacium glaucopus]